MDRAFSRVASGNCGLSDGSAAGDWRLPNLRELESLVDLRVCELFNFAAALSTNLYFAASGLAESDRLPIGLKVAVNRTKWAFVAVFPRIIGS